MENTENIKSAEDLTTPSKPPAPTVVIPEQKPTVSTQEPQQPQPQPQPPVLSPPDTAAPDPSSADDQSLAAKVKKGTNYSKEEIKKLLGLVQEGLPITDEEWEQLATKFNDGGSVKRTTASLRNKFVVLHNNANYTQTVEVLRKSLREKANNGESGDNGSGSHDSHESSSKFSPPSPDNEDSQEDTHGAKRKRGKTGSFNNFVFEDSQQPPQKVVSLDPLSEISLSMAILARSSLDRYSEPQLQHATPKVDCKNNIHQYFVSPNNSFIYCRACGNVIKL